MKSLLLPLLSLLILSFTATQSYANWAAAVGITGDLVYSESYPSLSGATSSALSRCQSSGFKDCKIVGSGASGCFAAASTSATPPRWGFGVATRRFDAAGKAVAACQALKAGQCHVTFMSFCR